MNGSDEVFGAERPRLLGLAYRILASYADAEDVVQEAWIRWRGADHDTIERPAAYLAAITTRLALDRARTIARRRCRLRSGRHQGHQDPLRAPRANTICERVVGTIRRECLDRMLILGRRHLEAVLAEYVEHYNSHRPHRSLDQRAPSTFDSLPLPAPDEEIDLARLRRTDRLAGLIHEYRMVA